MSSKNRNHRDHARLHTERLVDTHKSQLPFKVTSEAELNRLADRNEMYRRNTDTHCVNCGDPSMYRWMTFGFCAKHKDNASRFMKAVPDIAALMRMGLGKDLVR